MSKNQDLGELINGIRSLATNQLNAPAYTSSSSFTGTLAGILGFDSSGNIITTSAAGVGVTSFNTRTGAVTLSSGDVTGALGFTPYNATNPSGFISGINSGMVTSALGYTPVPPSRTLTINGVTYDLSADRSWTVSGSGTITGAGLNNYITKWTGTSSIGISNIQDSSTLVSINSETYVNGLLSANKLILYGGPEMIRMYAAAPFISFYNAANTTRFGYIQAYAGEMAIVAEASNPLNFNVGGSNRLTISTSGAATFSSSVTAKSALLNGTAVSVLADGIRVNRDPSTASSAIFNANGGAANIISNSGTTSSFSPITFRLSDNTTTNEVMRITSAENVGIGTSSPATKLHVKGALTIERSNAAQSSTISNEGGNFYITASSGYNTIFSDGATERMRISSFGQLLINATSSAYSANQFGYNLGVRGNNSQAFISIARATQTLDSQGLIVGLDTSSAYMIVHDNIPLSFFTNGTEFMRITNAGSTVATLVIGSTVSSRTAAGLSISNRPVCISSRADADNSGTHHEFVKPNGQIVGQITTNSSNTTYSTSSDYRLKYDNKDLQALDLIDNLKIYQYKWKVDNSIGYGVMAHELQEYIPYAVTGQKDGAEMQAVDYSKLAPIAIAGVKQLNKMFESHTQKIARLELEVAFLKSNIS